jgi:predicted acyltransferase
VGAVLLGWLWDIQFPVVKKLWSSSFVLVAGGYSAVLLAAFYWVIDVKQWRWWCMPFVWFGCNAITIYLANTLVGGFRSVAGRFVGGDVRAFFETNVTKGFGDLVVALVGMLLAFLFLRFLYQKKLFLRL